MHDVAIRAPIWLSLALYGVSAVWWFRSRRPEAEPKRAIRARRGVWTLAWLFFVVHVILAFALRHQWSHAHAYEDTAQRTLDAFGFRFGEGIWVNHFFLVAWGVDCALDWIRACAQRESSRWMQAFAAFMFFQGAIVFGGWPARVLGAVVFAAIATAAFRWLTPSRPAPYRRAP